MSYKIGVDCDDWGEDDEDVMTGECDHCGEEGRVRRSNDPFRAEVNPGQTNARSWWCSPCWHSRHDDI